jgi:hypothetical protein
MEPGTGLPPITVTGTLTEKALGVFTNTVRLNVMDLYLQAADTIFVEEKHTPGSHR